MINKKWHLVYNVWLNSFSSLEGERVSVVLVSLTSTPSTKLDVVKIILNGVIKNPLLKSVLFVRFLFRWHGVAFLTIDMFEVALSILIFYDGILLIV